MNMQDYQSDKITRQELFQNWRIFRSGMLALPKLEAQLVLDIEELSHTGVSAQKSEVQYWYLGNSIVEIVELIDNTARGINFINRAVGQSHISDQDMENKLNNYIKEYPNSSVVIRHIRHIGGYREYLKRMSTFLDSRRRSFVACIEVINKADRASNEEVLMGEIALRVGDCLPGGPASEEPGVVYSFVCLAGLLGALFCAAVIVATLVLTEGEAGGDTDGNGNGNGNGDAGGGGDGDLGDFPIPDPGGDTPA